MSTSTVDRLLGLKNRIEGRQREAAQIEGRIETYKAQLKEKFKVGSLKEAKDLLSKKEKTLLVVEAELEAKLTELENMLESEE